MRVLLKMNGNFQVDKIYELEVLEDGNVMLWTPADLLNIVVTGMSDFDIKNATMKLLRYGYTDLSKFHAEYEEDEDDEPGEDLKRVFL